MTTKLEVDDIADFDVDDAEETLIALLELALVEDLDGDDRRLLHDTADKHIEQHGAWLVLVMTDTSKFSFQ